MTDQDRINSIIAAIQTDSTLIAVLRILVTNNIVNVPTDKLIALQTALGLPTQ